MKNQLGIGCFFIIIFFSFACTTPEKSPEKLAKQYCSSCHIFPEPSLLTKNVWDKGVLPEMALRMGIDNALLWKIPAIDIPEVTKTIPANPMVTQEQWESIRNYYLTNAPDSIPHTGEKNALGLKQFTASTFKLPIKTLPAITLLKYDSFSKSIFIGTRFSRLYHFSQSLVLQDSFQLSSPPSSIIFQANQKPVLACMGIMDPNDQPAGDVVLLKSNKEVPEIIIDSLKRPVHIDKQDMNNDGEPDFIVSSFGNYTGNLSVFEKTKLRYRQHVIHQLPGTIKTLIMDFNSDGLSDILALHTQGDEQLTLYINKGDFEFTQQILLRFPPVYGSSYFETLDFNHDGKFDILYTNGDNADHSNILKPYHGIRLFINDGKNNFRQEWFHPMPGAFKALAKDFDKDGDSDIAAISFFPDFEKSPEQGFMYFENNNGNFLPQVTPLGAAGRWLTMECADIDNDNDDDILLGALNFPSQVPDLLQQQWERKNSAVLILKNNLH